MEQSKYNSKEYYVIDLAHIAKTIWHKVWVVVIVSILTAVIGFSYAKFGVTPTYASSIMLYVNNSSFDVGDIGFSISSSEITAAQSLVKTYSVLLKNRTTLERVVEETGVSYTWNDLYYMIEASPVDDTEVMGVTVLSDDPKEAEIIANGIAEVLPKRVSEIVEGSSMEVVDYAIAATSPIEPNVKHYAFTGFMIGLLLSVGALVVIALRDNTIHSEEYVTETYEYPILARVPDLLNIGTNKYGYYQQSKKNNR